MKYSYNWLKELSGTKKSPKQLAELLTMHSFELEELKTEGKETQLEFAILPNRAHDALSHIGMAREICAVEGRKFDRAFLRSDLRTLLRSDLRMNIAIKDKKLCPRYIGVVVENIKVASSPRWMQERLLASGVKPINNVVDITNYAMLETGQPLHAFDATKLVTRNTKHEIVVRRARKGEIIKLLDEKEYQLNENDLVIADAEKPIALAGVMGGLESGVTEKTAAIILESANFNSTNIRKTRTKHNIITESSYRFEREIDPNLAEFGAMRAVELLKKYAGKNISVAASADVYPKKIKPWAIKLDTDYANKLLGENIPTARMKNILENLGARVLGNLVSKSVAVEIPTVRIDLKTQEDLIEEIGRLYGYENIKEQAPQVSLKTPEFNRKRELEDKMRDIMAGLGFSEVMNYSFYGAEDIEKCNLEKEDHLEVANPMNPEQMFMRWSLIPGLLKNAALNQKYTESFRIFELGRKYLQRKGKLPLEKTIVAGAIYENENSLFLTLKGCVSEMLAKQNIENISYESKIEKHYVFHPARSAEIVVGNKKIGRMGEINPSILKKYGIKGRMAAFGIRLDDVLEFVRDHTEYRLISKYPSVKRDISMFVPENVAYAGIENEIKKSGGELMKNIELFDVFKDSLAVRVEIGSDKKTLTAEEIDHVMKKIISALEKALKVKIRK